MSSIWTGRSTGSHGAESERSSSSEVSTRASSRSTATWGMRIER